MPRDLKLFYFAFFLMRGRAKKILVFMIRNSSCKFDNVANVYNKGRTLDTCVRILARSAVIRMKSNAKYYMLNTTRL